MLNTCSLSLIIWKAAIETWAREMNGGPGTISGSEQLPRLDITLSVVNSIIFIYLFIYLFITPLGQHIKKTHMLLLRLLSTVWMCVLRETRLIDIDWRRALQMDLLTYWLTPTLEATPECRLEVWKSVIEMKWKCIDFKCCVHFKSINRGDIFKTVMTYDRSKVCRKRSQN